MRRRAAPRRPPRSGARLPASLPPWLGALRALDDVAALARMAAASVDDVGAAAGRATTKAAGVVVDDTAVTPQYVHGVAADRELPMIKRITIGLAAQQAAVHPPGGAAAQPVPALAAHADPDGRRHLPLLRGRREGVGPDPRPRRTTTSRSPRVGPEAEKAMVSGAIRTDLILSAEIMVIALNEVADEPFLRRVIILVVVAIAITHRRVRRGRDHREARRHRPRTWPSAPRRPRSGSAAAPGQRDAPKLLATISVVGIAAMLWVGGHILLVGSSTSSAGTRRTTRCTTSRRRSTTPSAASAASPAG